MLPNKRTNAGAILLGLCLALAVQAEDDAATKAKAARQRASNDMHALLLAMHDYHRVYGHIPPAAVLDKSGKPLLSWRVLLLPYLEQDELFKQFRLNEPWDSAHNKPLLAKMPKQYEPPLPDKTKEKYATFYQGFVGKGAMFEGKRGIPITSVIDGTSNTVVIAEASEAVPWTKPADLAFDPKKPLPKIGGMFDKSFPAGFADGSVRFLKRDFDVDNMRAVIGRNDWYLVNFDKLDPEK